MLTENEFSGFFRFNRYLEPEDLDDVVVVQQGADLELPYEHLLGGRPQENGFDGDLAGRPDRPLLRRPPLASLHRVELDASVRASPDLFPNLSS